MYAYKREKYKKDIKGKKIKKWLIKKIKKVLTDGRFDDKIIFAVAETGSYLMVNRINDLNRSSIIVQKSS